MPHFLDSPPACLVPGAGLGRLALEISCLGFVSQGNEFSYYMMICSSFILNHAETAEQWTIYRWIHSNCNSFSDSDQLRPVSIPDIHPASNLKTITLSYWAREMYIKLVQIDSGLFWDLSIFMNLPDYLEVIEQPMDFGTVRKKLDKGRYSNLDEFEFFASDERIKAVRKMIMVVTSEQRKAALDVLLPFQRFDFEGIFRAMDGSGMHGYRLMEDVDDVPFRKMKLEGRKMLAEKVPRREVEEEEDQLNGGTSKISGASATHSARKCHGKKDLNAKYRVLMGQTAKIPNKLKGAAGFVHFTVDYDDIRPVGHLPRNN